jgi:hypothetical protein
MVLRRFTRLTNSFSKKVENHAAAISLHFYFDDYGRAHKSLANPCPRTPAMAGGIADHVWTCEEIAALLDLTGRKRKEPVPPMAVCWEVAGSFCLCGAVR